MAKRHEFFQSRYLKAIDLGGKSRVEEISQAPSEMLGDDPMPKTVLYFRGGTKPLSLNMINWDSVAAIAGDDTDYWAGHRIELYPDKTNLRGNTVDCVRIRAPQQQELLTPKAKADAASLAAEDTDEDIKF